MFPTKTSRDVGMVDGDSDPTGSSMETTGGRSLGTSRRIPRLCNYSVNIHCLQDTLWIDFTIPTSGSILMWHCFHGLNVRVTISICPPTHARKMIMNSI